MKSKAFLSQGFAVFLANLPALSCFVGATYLISIGVTNGWGWLIFAGLSTRMGFKTRTATCPKCNHYFEIKDSDEDSSQ